MTTSSVRISRKCGETRLEYIAEYDGVCYNLQVTAVPSVAETVSVRDIARKRADAERLCRLLADNLVFPISVYEVLDDLLGGNYFV